MFIYVLKDPDDGVVRYVGKTNNPKKRMSAHLSAPININLPSVRWVRSLKRLNKKPIMEIIEETDDWENCEKKWIAFYRNSTGCLLNIDEGGVVRVCNHANKNASKKYMAVIQKLSNLPIVSEEAKKEWAIIKDAIKKIRAEILESMESEAVEYFDECIYAEFIERKPKKFRILA